MSNTLVDLTGVRFGRWTVLPQRRRNKRHTEWLCKCECGTERWVSGKNIRKQKTNSCGCLARELTSIRFKGLPGKTRNPLAQELAIRHKYERNARDRKMEFDLSITQFKEIIDRPCHYCGAPPSNVYRGSRAAREYNYSGIDRVDNEKGYLIDNVRPCCHTCNRAKSNMGEEKFYAWIKRLVAFSREDILAR